MKKDEKWYVSCLVILSFALPILLYGLLSNFFVVFSSGEMQSANNKAVVLCIFMVFMGLTLSVSVQHYSNTKKFSLSGWWKHAPGFRFMLLVFSFVTIFLISLNIWLSIGLILVWIIFRAAMTSWFTRFGEQVVQASLDQDISLLEKTLHSFYKKGKYPQIRENLVTKLPEWEISKYVREASEQIFHLKQNIAVVRKQNNLNSLLDQFEEVADKAANILWSVSGTLAAFKQTGYKPAQSNNFKTPNLHGVRQPITNANILEQQAERIKNIERTAREANEAILVLALSKSLGSSDVKQIELHLQSLNSSVSETYTLN
jgi:hypothetical protein